MGHVVDDSTLYDKKLKRGNIIDKAHPREDLTRDDLLWVVKFEKIVVSAMFVKQEAYV